MGLVDLFRAKWKHSDAEVRAAAVRELGADEADVIITIARSDADAGVRRIAIKKLDDPGVLGEIAVSDPDESLRQIAEEKASSILLSTACGSDQAAAAAALDKINDQRALADVAKQASQKDLRAAAAKRLTDQKALADVARNAKELSTRLEALRQITDVPVLRSLALNEERKEIALAALDGIEERDALEAIAHKGKNKAVRGQARKKLQELAPDKRPVDRHVQTRRAQLCQTAEVLCRASDWEATGRRLEELQREWDGLEGETDDELQARFSSAYETFFSRLAQHQKERAERAKEEQQLRELLGECVTVCEEVEAVAAGPARETLPAEIERLRQRWEELDPIPEAHREVIEQRFAKACEEATARYEGFKAAEAQRGQLEELCTRAEAVAGSRQRDTQRQMRELQDEWRRIRAPREGELYERFCAAAERLDQQEIEAKERQEKQKLENQRRLETLCDRLETKVDTDNLKVAERLLKEAQAAIKRSGDLPSREDKDQLLGRLKGAREKLFTRTQELREAEEWKRWSMVPKLEALCEEVEGLAKVEDLKEVSKRLRKAQGRWKKVGTAPRSKSEELWKRFKAACDKAYERCQVVFEQSEQEREENLKLKEGLCEKVEALQDAESFAETAATIKQIQLEWKNVGPVPRAKSDAVWQRFRKACDHFFDRRQQHLDQEGGQRDENLKLKDELCVQVEALQDDTSWDETAEAIKRLQAQWKEIGPVPRAKSKAIWQRFRKACDHFFDRRQEHLDEGRMEALQRKEELCQRIEALAQPPGEGDQPEPDKVVSAIFEARAMWKELGPVPRSRSDEIWNRFTSACERVVEVHPKYFKGTELDPEANLRRKEELCAQVEALIEANTPVAPPPPAEPVESAAELAGSVEAMAEKLREALAANALGAGAEDTKVAPDWATAAREVKGLQESWKKLGPVPGEAGEVVWTRFRAACDHVFAQLRPDRPDRKRAPAPRVEDGQQEENLKLKQAICEEAEALAAAEDPTEHREAIRELRRRWKAAGLVPKAQARKLWNRFRRACNNVMSEGRPEVQEGDDRQAPEAADAAAPDDAAASAEAAPVEAAPVEAAPAEAAPAETPAAASPEAAEKSAASGWDESLDDGWDDVLLPDNSGTDGEEEARGAPGTNTGEE